MFAVLWGTVSGRVIAGANPGSSVSFNHATLLPAPNCATSCNTYMAVLAASYNGTVAGLPNVTSPTAAVIMNTFSQTQWNQTNAVTRPSSSEREEKTSREDPVSELQKAEERGV